MSRLPSPPPSTPRTVVVVAAAAVVVSRTAAPPLVVASSARGFRRRPFSPRIATATTRTRATTFARGIVATFPRGGGDDDDDDASPAAAAAATLSASAVAPSFAVRSEGEERETEAAVDVDADADAAPSSSVLPPSGEGEEEEGGGATTTTIVVAPSEGNVVPEEGKRGETTEEEDGTTYVTKRDGTREPLRREKILATLRSLSADLDSVRLSIADLADAVIRGSYPDVSTDELAVLAAETAASKSTRHPHYSTLAGRICALRIHKRTPSTFSEAMERLHDGGNGFVDGEIAELVRRHKDSIDSKIVHERDRENVTYFGHRTLERSYLLKDDDGTIVERPQYMLMRVALGVHCRASPASASSHEATNETEERSNLEAAFETYDMMSRGLFVHASPTLFHSGTVHPQLSSCFLVRMSEDSIDGIYDTLKRCAAISKSAGGIGLSVHNIRARGTLIRGTRGVSNGLVPMLRVYDATSRYVDQGGGKRPGAFAIYLEPWHADVFDVLNLKKNHGKEEQRARDLFYGLWIPDLFMERVRDDGHWSLMCPRACPGLSSVHGTEFRDLYERYESEGKYVRRVRARELWTSILDAQIETGTPYVLYKDACNDKSNQKNLGTIRCSNLCTEIVQYSDEEEVAVCNLASICLPKFVVSDRGPHGSTDPSTSSAYFDHAALHRATKVVAKNLDKIIDVNLYPVPAARRSNFRHRPIGIGVSGLADAFVRLGYPFDSPAAKELNEAIFETIYHAALESSAELAEKHGPYETFRGSPASGGILQFQLWGTEDDETPSRRMAAARAAAAAAERRRSSSSSSGSDRAPPPPPSKHRYDERHRKNGYDWPELRRRIVSTGLRNSLLVAPMPTASTSQILGVNECFEPFVSNLYLRRVKAGEFIVANPHLLNDLADLGLWNDAVRNELMRDGGSVANIDAVPRRLKDLYRTVWEIKMRDVIDMAADRGKFVDQSQSLNLFVSDPTVDKLTAMHFYAWKKGLKTGMYYLRTRPAVNAIQYTVEKSDDDDDDDDDESADSDVRRPPLPTQDDEAVCLSCQA